MKYIKMFVLVLLSIFVMVLVCHDEVLYRTSILKITDIKEIGIDYDSNDLGLQETVYEEEITGVYLNGEHKGEMVTCKNTYSESFVVTEKYNVGDKVFYRDGEIDGFKRDEYFVFMVIVLFLAVYLIGHFHGILTFVCVFVNSILFYLDLVLYSQGVNILFLMIVTSILFTVLSLIAAVGLSKKTYISILSVFVSSTVLFLLLGAIALITGFKGVNFNVLSYLTVPPEEIFLAGLIIGGLGAVMDVSITIVSSISELLKTNPKITNKQILDSSREIGKDIMPTMINVLFFTYFCGGLPVFVLAIRNGFTILNYLKTFYTLEVTRFLSGSIGICLTIPISTFLSILIYRKGEKYE